MFIQENLLNLGKNSTVCDNSSPLTPSPVSPNCSHWCWRPATYSDLQRPNGTSGVWSSPENLIWSAVLLFDLSHSSLEKFCCFTQLDSVLFFRETFILKALGETISSDHSSSCCLGPQCQSGQTRAKNLAKNLKKGDLWNDRQI